MKKYTYITDHPRNRRYYIYKVDELIDRMDVRQLMKLYAFAHRMVRDKVK